MGNNQEKLRELASDNERELRELKREIEISRPSTNISLFALRIHLMQNIQLADNKLIVIFNECIHTNEVSKIFKEAICPDVSTNDFYDPFTLLTDMQLEKECEKLKQILLKKFDAVNKLLKLSML